MYSATLQVRYWACQMAGFLTRHCLLQGRYFLLGIFVSQTVQSCDCHTRLVKESCLFELQLKRKARESGEADMGVTLASAAGSDEEESSDQEREEDDAVRHEQEDDSDNDGIAYEGDLTSSDEDDEQNQPKQASVAGKAAYFGMQKKSNAASATEYEGLSLAEQEALALRMIKK